LSTGGSVPERATAPLAGPTEGPLVLAAAALTDGNAVAAQDVDRADGRVAAPVEGPGGGDLEEVDDPAAVVLLQGDQAIEVGGEDLGGEQVACRAVG
jgi:hypothetical protein